jgi:hypothetical protein
MKRVYGMYDMPTNRRLVGACWLSASLGAAILQMRLYAQVWQQGHGSALLIGLVSGAWMLGAFASARWRVESRIWPYALVIAVVLWVAVTLIDWQRLNIPSPFVPFVTLLGLCAAGLSLGWIGTAWLSQSRRGWAFVGERWILAAALTCGTTALVIVWLTVERAYVALLLGLALLIPLLVLEARPLWRRPLHAAGGLVDAWQLRVQRGGTTSTAPVRLDMSALPRDWWWSYLVARGRGGLTLYASCIAILLGSMWAVVPTAYAGSLQAVGMLGKLPWLLGGLLCAFAIGSAGGLSGLTGPTRSLFGLSDRVLPPRWQQQARWLACIPPLVMAVALITLGYPTLQQPWELGVSLGIYTLAALAWSVLLPRLRPALSTEISTTRHLHQQPGVTRILPLRQAQEAAVNRAILTIESLLMILLAPLMGALIDSLTVDGLLVRMGAGIVVLVGIATVIVLVRQPKPAVSLSCWIGHAQPAFQRIDEGDSAYIPVSLTSSRSSPNGFV